jgi:hypothetical protein
VRAAILAEGRRVAAELQKKGGQHTFDTARPAANDSRWKITAFGTVGAALLAALIIAPRYWETLPPRKESAAAPAASQPAPPEAPAPKAESAEQATVGGSLKESLVPSAKRRQAEPPPESAAKPAAVAPKDAELRNEPAPVSAPPLPAPSEEKKQTTSSALSADSTAPSRFIGGRPSPSVELQIAAESGNALLATKLLDRGASVNARDEDGRTPLMLAVAQGRLEIVRLLLQRGADPNAADYSGKTPLQLAADQNLNDMVALLRGAGAR